MAFLGNKQEVERLSIENMSLTNKISALEKTLALKEENIADLQGEIACLREEVEYIDRRAEEFYSGAKKVIAQQQANYEAVYDSLKIRPHNERNAGRKSRATPEQKAEIISLRQSGNGYKRIAQIMSEKTGSAWNKTTIRNIACSPGVNN
jgi:uncharacterized coiled-coil protein SlyX